MLIENGAKESINKADNKPYVYTPLYLACYKNHLDMVKYLIENGAEIDKKAEKEAQNNITIINYFELIKIYTDLNDLKKLDFILGQNKTEQKDLVRLVFGQAIRDANKDAKNMIFFCSLCKKLKDKMKDIFFVEYQKDLFGFVLNVINKNSYYYDRSRLKRIHEKVSFFDKLKSKENKKFSDLIIKTHL